MKLKDAMNISEIIEGIKPEEFASFLQMNYEEYASEILDKLQEEQVIEHTNQTYIDIEKEKQC
jgi:hypothetical protein